MTSRQTTEASVQFPSNDDAEKPVHQLVLVTVLMPCLNESRTLAACINQAHHGCRNALLSYGRIKDDAVPNACHTHQEWTYEILIADNGSTDGSQAIAKDNGARVVNVENRGYGAAVLGGVSAARGRYIVMGDSDCSYSFEEIGSFLAKLCEGYDLVMGNRFIGGIKVGAMPWHHRYIGNPLLSFIGRLLYPTPCRDWHCGLRAFDRQSIVSLNLESQGMELASEIVLKSSQWNLKQTEIPVVLSPDGRDRPPHLRSFRDGFRHLSLLMRSKMKRR
jgi:glycosyltransferase involved in cell wall biosynthesis